MTTRYSAQTQTILRFLSVQKDSKWACTRTTLRAKLSVKLAPLLSNTLRPTSNLAKLKINRIGTQGNPLTMSFWTTKFSISPRFPHRRTKKSGSALFWTTLTFALRPFQRSHQFFKWWPTAPSKSLLTSKTPSFKTLTIFRSYSGNSESTPTIPSLEN